MMPSSVVVAAFVTFDTDTVTHSRSLRSSPMTAARIMAVRTGNRRLAQTMVIRIRSHSLIRIMVRKKEIQLSHTSRMRAIRKAGMLSSHSLKKLSQAIR